MWWGADPPAKDHARECSGSAPEGQVKGPDEQVKGQVRVKVRFSQRDCASCPSRTKCVRSEAGRARTLILPTKECYEALQQTRTMLNSEEGRAEYRKRAGIEGTLSQGVRHCDLRHSRYRGLVKTHLQHIVTATGLNVLRTINHLNQLSLAPTRKSRFARLCA